MHASLSDLVLEIVANAIESGARRVALRIRQTPERFEVETVDNGKGMSPEQVALCGRPGLSEPGKHAARPRGFGLAFLRQSVDATGGEFEIGSKKGSGTRVFFGFDLRHVDTPPIGDLENALLLALSMPGEYELEVQRWNGAAGWQVTRGELVEVLGDLERADNLLAARGYLRSQEAVTRERETL